MPGLQIFHIPRALAIHSGPPSTPEQNATKATLSLISVAVFGVQKVYSFELLHIVIRIRAIKVSIIDAECHHIYPNSPP